MTTLLPRPLHHETTPGYFDLPERLSVSGPWADTVQMLLAPGTGVGVDVTDGGGHIVVDQAEATPESYTVEISPEGIRIAAPDLGGVVNACATLRGLMPEWTELPQPPAGQRVERLPYCRIEDAPQFAWRGVHLDVARHYLPLAWVFQFVDRAARLKLNRLHLHLTDDQGWRFEVKSHPRLVERASWRPHTQYPTWSEHDGTPHGGYYTQDQLRALVGYAKARNITIVPEIDLPGHTRALLQAYPELGVGEPTIATEVAVFPEVLELHDETMAVVKDILGELLDVFDSPWIHIGGDECPRVQWRASAAMADKAAGLGLEGGVEGLQRWFTKELQAFIESRGRVVLAWDEVLDDGPLPGAVVMAWRGVEAGRRAVEMGNQVVLAPDPVAYLDHHQADTDDERIAMGGNVTWEEVLQWDPLEGLDGAAGQVLGLQAQLWTEYLPTPRHVEYMAFPKLLIVSELAWRGAITQPEAFMPVLESNIARLEAAGVNVRPLTGPRPWQKAGTGPFRRAARPE